MSDNRARQELRDWTRVRGYWDRAAESLELAANASDPDVQDRSSRSHRITARWQKQKNEAQIKKAPNDVHSAWRASLPARRNVNLKARWNFGKSRAYFQLRQRNLSVAPTSRCLR